jgi:hypothetical protein
MSKEATKKIEAVRYHLASVGVKGVRFCVLWHLAWHQHPKTGLINPSERTLSGETGFSERAIRNAVAALEAKRLLRITRTPPTRHGWRTTNKYYIQYGELESLMSAKQDTGTSYRSGGTTFQDQRHPVRRQAAPPASNKTNQEQVLKNIKRDPRAKVFSPVGSSPKKSPTTGPENRAADLGYAESACDADNWEPEPPDDEAARYLEWCARNPPDFDPEDDLLSRCDDYPIVSYRFVRIDGSTGRRVFDKLENGKVVGQVTSKRRFSDWAEHPEK